MQTTRHAARLATLVAALSLLAGAPAELLAQREARDDEYAVNDPRVQRPWPVAA